jgi:plastocyanin
MRLKVFHPGPILLSLALLATALFEWQTAFAQSGDTGSIEGIVTFMGEIPKSTMSDDAGVRHDLLEVDKETRGLRYVVVYLTGVDGSTIPLKPTERAKRSFEKLLVDQVDYAFAPRVLAVQEGKAVTFKNSDPANHNVRTTAGNKTNEFNMFTGVDGKYEHRFGLEPQHQPVRLGCDIHPWMRAWIYVFDHPYFGVTDEGGRFQISGIPPGAYQLHTVQPDIGHRDERKMSISANQTSKVEFVVRRDATKQP